MIWFSFDILSVAWQCCDHFLRITSITNSHFSSTSWLSSQLSSSSSNSLAKLCCSFPVSCASIKWLVAVLNHFSSTCTLPVISWFEQNETSFRHLVEVEQQFKNISKKKKSIRGIPDFSTCFKYQMKQTSKCKIKLHTNN